MIKITLKLVVFLCFTVICNPGMAASSFQVFVLHSYTQEYPWTKSQHEGFTARLYANAPHSSLISTEYLDTKRIQYDREYADSYFGFIKKKYAGYTPDIIYVTDDNALSFALEYLAGYFSTAPIVFSGVNNYSIQERLDSSRITGVFEEKNISRNIEIIKDIDPDIQSIVIVGDDSSTYKTIESDIKQHLINYPSITAGFISSHRIENIISLLSVRNEKYLFLTTLGSVVNEKGDTLALKETISNISEMEKFIIISMEDSYLMDGVLGGYVTIGKYQGSVAAEIVVDYLAGNPIREFPAITKSPNEYIFNYKEIEKNKIKLSDDILNQSTIINLPPAFYDSNKFLIIGIITVIIFIFILSLLGIIIVMTRKFFLIKSALINKHDLEVLIDRRTNDLQAEKKKLSQAQIIAHIGSYNWNVIEDITSWTDEMYRIVGYMPSDFQPSYEKYLSCIHPEDREMFRALSHSVLQKKSAYEAEYRVVRPDGDIRYVREQGDVKLVQGEMTDMVGVIQDITEQKKQEFELESQRDFTDAIVEVAGNIIVVLDMNGCFVVFNNEAEKLTSFRREEVLGKSVWDVVIPEEQMEGVKNVFENLRKGKTDIAGQYENDWLVRGGGRITLEWRNTVLRNKTNQATHIVALGYDITGRKAAEIQKERMQRELNQAQKMDALGKLTGGIAHDFNNMLGIITGYSDLALVSLNEARKSDMQKYLENISHASSRATDLVKQMMVFSRTDTDKIVPCDFVSAISENIKMLRSVMPSSIEMNFTYENNLPNINMDVVQMQQIMMNICLNAKDAMNGQGILNINLGLHKNINTECFSCHKHIAGDWLELSVSDNGAGMEKDVINRIFEPFFTTKEVGKGTGLGLSMINSIVENHNGHILLKSVVGQGTTFYFLFPPVLDPLPDEDMRDSEVLSKEFTGNGEKILIVDDELALAKYVEEILSNNGYQCVACTSSIEALKLFKTSPGYFDLVVTDQTMPDLTGIDLITEIHMISPNLPVIIATGYSDIINREMVEKKGIIYKNKPVKSDELLQCVAGIFKNN